MRYFFGILFFGIFGISMLQAECQIYPKETVPGGVLKVVCDFKDFALSPTVVFESKKIKMMKVDQHWQAFLGISYEIEIGDGEKTLFIGHVEIPFKIKTYDYPFTKIILLPEKKQAIQNPKISNEVNLIGAAFRKFSLVSSWTGLMRPVPEKTAISSPYGDRRDYWLSGKKVNSWYHRGTDYAVPEGTELKAVGSGRVILAQKFVSHGNTLVIDHGMGVLSIYNHLSKLEVKEGQFVQKGQKVALSGNTGITTGPHLHLGLSVNNIRVNPEFWFEQGF